MPKPPKVEPPSKQYRTSAYTVRQYMALPYAERMAVDAGCTAMAAANRASSEGNQKHIAGPGAGGPATGSETPDQLSPTQSQQLAMQLTTADLATEEATIETAQLSSQIDKQAPAPELKAATGAADEPLPYSTDILTVVGEYVTLHEHSGSTDWTHWGPTPLADSEGVQFALNAHKNTYKCFVSGSAGGIVAFVKALKKLSYAGALAWLSTNYPLPAEPEDLPEQQEAAEAPTTAASVVAPEPTYAATLDGGTFQTTDYDMFHLLPENRPVDLGHVRKLVAMITKSNLLHVKPLDVTTTMGVIDGQHRLAAARQLGLPVYYKIGQQLTQADITTLNVAQRNWQGTDYLHYWTVKGKTDYVALTAFMKRHSKLSFSNAKMMLGVSTKSNAEEFRAGQWKAGEAYKAEQVAEFIERISVDVPSFKQPNHSGFVAYIFHCVCEVERFSTKTCLERILKNPLMLVPCASHKQFVQMFDALYNYRVNAENRVHFT
ncbi:MAG: CHC2 zinc finger domain-containing protein [Janthinobacterium lividum]